MPPANGQTRKTEYSTVIYLRGTQAEQLDDAERRCREYAARFGWHVLASIRDNRPAATTDQFLAKVSRPGAQILLTDTPDMISSDQATRDDLTMAVEGTGCLVHPLTQPRICASPAEGASSAAPAASMPKPAES
jgi:hypothetical protein